MHQPGAARTFWASRSATNRTCSGETATTCGWAPRGKPKSTAEVREQTGPAWCWLPLPNLIGRLNQTLRGWCAYFRHGHPHRVFYRLDGYLLDRLRQHLRRRSQRRYRTPANESLDAHLQSHGLQYPTDLVHPFIEPARGMSARIAKSASKRLKSSHACGFPAENRGAGRAAESLKRCQTGPKQCQISLISLRIETVRGFSERQCPQSEMIEARRMDVRSVLCSTSNNASILPSGPRSPSPTGICPLAQGWCEERAPTLGNGSDPMPPTPLGNAVKDFGTVNSGLDGNWRI